MHGHSNKLSGTDPFKVQLLCTCYHSTRLISSMFVRMCCSGDYRPLPPVYGEYDYLPPQRWMCALTVCVKRYLIESRQLSSLYPPLSLTLSLPPLILSPHLVLSYSLLTSFSLTLSLPLSTFLFFLALDLASTERWPFSITRVPPRSK